MGSDAYLENFTEQLFDQLHIGIIGFGPDFRVKCLNQAVQAYIKDAPEAWEGTPIDQLFDDWATDLPSIKNMLESGKGDQCMATICLDQLHGKFAFDVRPVLNDGVFQGGYLAFNPEKPITDDLPEPGWSALVKGFNVSREAMLITETNLDPPGPRILEVNPAFTTLTGYSREELIGQTPRFFQGPKTDRQVLDRLRDQLAKGEVFEGETVNYRKDGSEYIVQWEIHPLTNSDGNATQYLAVQRDVTALRMAEESLKEKETQFRNLITNAPVAMFVHDKGELLFANERAAQVFGFRNTDELLGRNLFHYIREDFRGIAKDRLKQLESGKPIEPLEEVFLKADGSEMDVEVVGIPFTYNGRMAIQTIVIDISERKRAERALKENEAHFRMITENSRDIIGMHDRDACFTYASPSVKEILGVAPEDMIGQSPYPFMHPDDKDYLAQIHDKLLNGEEIRKARSRVSHVDGYYVWIEAHLFPVTDEKGQITHFQSLSRDVTEEQNLRELLEETQEIAELGGWSYNLDNQTFFFSKKIHDIYGIPYEESIDKERAIVHYDPEHQPIIRKAFDDLVEEGKPFDLKLRFWHAQQNKLWVRAIGKPYYEGDRMVKVGGTLQNITEERETQKELERLFNHSVEMIAIGSQGYLKRINPRWTEVLGWSEATLKAYPFIEFMHPDDQEGAKAMTRKLDRGHEIRFFEARFKRSDGNYRWLSWNGLKDEENQVGYAFVRDITERKEAKQQLEFNETLMNNIFHQTADALFLLKTADGTIAKVNEQALQLFGMEESEVTGQPGPCWLGIPVSQGFYHRIDQNHLFENGHSEETIFQTKNGKNFWGLLTLRRFLLNGEYYDLFDIRDITERKAMEDRLQESEETFRAFAEKSLVGVYMYQDGKMKYANPKMTEITGYSLEEIRGKSPLDIAHPEDKALMEEKIRNRETGKSEGEHYEFRFYTKQGELKHAELFGSKIMNKGRPAIIGTMLDVTKRKVMERRLKESEERFRNLSERSLVGVFMIQNYKAEYVNPKMEEITGYSKDELLNEFSPLETIHPEDYPIVKQKINSRVAGEEDTAQYEFRLVRKQGDIRHVEVYGTRFIYNDQPAIIGTMLDVTERKEAEKQLLEHQHFIEKVTTTSPNIISVVDYQEHRYVYGNKKAKDFIGYSFEEINQFDNLVLDLLHPEDAKDNQAKLNKNLLLKDGEVNPIEFRMKTKSGQYRWFLSLDTPFKRDEKGHVVQILSTVQDITERKEADKEILENQRFIQSIAENSPNIIHIFNYEENRFIYSNRYMVNLLGYSFEEFKAFPNGSWDLYHPGDFPVIEDLYYQNLQLADGETNDQEFRMKDKSGQWRWLYSRDTVFRRDENENVIETIGIVQDITERKNAEESLKRSEALFRQLFRNAPIGIVILDQDYATKDINEGFTEMFGYTLEEIETQNVDDIIVPDGYEGEAGHITSKTLKGQTHIQETFRIDKSGEWVPVLIYGVPVFYEGHPLNIFGIYVDMTEREKVIDDLRQQTNELLRINAELEQFAYVTSHNLRSPVVNLQTLVDFFDDSELQNEENQYMFKKIEQSVNQLGETLEDLVGIVAKKKELSQPKEKIDFEKLLAKVKNALHNQLITAEAEIKADFTKAPSIYYLRSFLESILQNLISNAIKYRSQNRQLIMQITTEKKNGYVCLTFSDNGQGIDLDRYGDQIFSLYKRFHQGGSGKGIGLYLIKTQVDSLGGKIEIDSEVNKGTTFYLYLKDFEGS